MENDVKEPENDSIITIKFAAVGSVMFGIDMQNVTPMQLLAVAEYFRIRGEAMLIQQEVQRERMAQANKIAVPAPQINIARK